MKQFFLIACLLVITLGFLKVPNRAFVKNHLKNFQKTDDVIIEEDSSNEFTLEGVDQVAGYATIDKSVGSALFYWYFTSVHTKKPQATVIWLTGGPGCSSETGAFYEYIAPIQISSDGSKTFRMANSWGDDFATLFIDNPIGTGYSTRGNGTYRTSTIDSSKDFLHALKGIKDMHPEWFEVPLYIFGESYAGHYIPQYSYDLLHDGSFPLEGIGIGDGWTDPFNQLSHNADYAYSVGLLDLNDWQIIRNLELSGQNAITAGDYATALDNFNEITSKIVEVSGGVDIYNFRNYAPLNMDNLNQFLNTNDTKDLLGVPLQKNWQFCDDQVNYNYNNDFMKSYAGVFPYLFSKIKVLLYNGADDIIVNTPSWEVYISEIKWDGRDDFLKKDRKPWIIGDTISGYLKQQDNFTQLIVLKAGHMVPMDQKTNSRELLRTFIYDLPWSTL